MAFMHDQSLAHGQPRDRRFARFPAEAARRRIRMSFPINTAALHNTSRLNPIIHVE
jgi:hypothetical protein